LLIIAIRIGSYFRKADFKKVIRNCKHINSGADIVDAIAASLRAKNVAF